MPRVRVFEGGNIQSQGTTNARFRSADYGPGMGQGIEQLGKVASDVIDRQDQVEDVKARVEANRLAVEHSEHVRQISQRVRETLGEGAEAAADEGVDELQTATKELVSRASPRAQLLLQNELTQRSGAAIDSWHEHGFRQKGEALETSSVARIGRIVEDAADLDDEDAATQMLGQVRSINEQRANFFGKGKDWLVEEDRKVVSSFYKSRSLKLAGGQAGSASAAIAYAEQHRDMLTDNDYMDVLTSYNNSAMDEAATAMVYGGNPVGAAVEPAAPPKDGQPATDTPQAALDPVAFFKGFVSPHEGSARVTDSNGAVVQYGVNGAFHPEVNKGSISEDRAAEIFKTQYFIPSGADKLPPALAAIHSDTYWLNKKQAMKILKESGGDPDKYIELRRAFLNGLSTSNPAKYGKYQAGWENRTKQLADYADRQGGNGHILAVSPTQSLEGVRAAVMSRTDIGLNLKRRIIQQVEQRRAEVRQEQAIQEEAINNELMKTTVALGDNYTDVKQLPQGVFVNAPPKIQQQYIDMAKANKENKPLKPEVAAKIGYLRTFAPQKLAEPATQRWLAGQGVPPKTLTQLAQEGGQALGTVDQVSRSTLEGLARPAFEAAGHRFWTTEQDSKEDEKKGKTAAEQREDAANQIRLMNYLETEAIAWGQANPGKKADTATMQKWIGSSMIRTLNDRPFGTMTDEEVISTYGAKNYREVSNMLQQQGLTNPTPAEVATYLRRHFQRSHGGY